jgi:hypothetical protein
LRMVSFKVPGHGGYPFTPSRSSGDFDLKTTLFVVGAINLHLVS